MKNLKFNKKIITIITVFTLLNGSSNAEILYKIDYSKGIIYIINNSKDIIDNLNDLDLIILDERDNIDSNIKIYDSYKINDYDTMNEVINILLDYEELYPSNWDRTSISLFNEWKIHNLCYKFNYKTNRTKDVDFNNEDEDKYLKLYNK